MVGTIRKKVFAAFQKAKDTQNKPTVILAQTIKGYGMGETAEVKTSLTKLKK